MASWVVLEAPPGASVAEGEELVFLRDGFAFFAFVFAPLWLLWHRLWVEAIVVFALLMGTTAVERLGGLALAASAVSLLVSTYVGLEGSRMRIAARERRGWHPVSVIDAGSEGEAELRYADEVDLLEDERAADRQPIVPSVYAGSASQPAPVGLLLNPGR